MSPFLTLLLKLIPLYLVIMLGYLMGRFSDINRETIAKILIYIIAPIVVFNGAFKAQISTVTLLLPFIFFGIGCVLCGSFYYIAKRVGFSGAEKNIISFTSGTANTGYFGLPVAIAIFGNDIAPIAILLGLGTLLYESTLGFFVLAKGHYSTKDSFKRILKLPNIYAYLIGLSANVLHIHLGDNYATLASSFLGSYSVLGMLLIGLALPNIGKFCFDYKFNLLIFFIKFIAWPLLTLSIISLINYWLPHFFSPVLIGVMLLLSVVPLAANTVAYTVFLKILPEKTALTVLLSTLWSLIYIPLVILLVQMFSPF